MKILRLIIIFCIIPVITGYYSYYYVQNRYFTAADPENKTTVMVTIEPGKGMKEIAEFLAGYGLIKDAWGFALLARLRNQDTQMHAGEYQLAPSMSPQEILLKISNGEIFKRKVLIKEGATLVQIAEAVDAAGLVSTTEFIRETKNIERMRKLGIPASVSLEGYLFPQTYFFSRPATAAQIIEAMISEGGKTWTPEYNARGNELKMSRHDVLTLAAIIEKESGVVAEQPIISSVFHNRLGLGMKLQSDPTVIYGIKDYNGNITKEDLQTPTPYNTYTNFGLPPGPICSPGATAIKAALYPANSSALFFVANGHGAHVFSTTLAEHNENVAKYQLKRDN